MSDRLERAPPIFFERFAFPGEHRDARFGDRRRGVVLRRENIAARPAHGGAEIDQRLDQHRRLNRHVQRTGDAHALQRLARRIFFADGHQAGHFLLGDDDFFAAPFGEADVFDFVIVVPVLWRRCMSSRTRLELLVLLPYIQLRFS